MLGGIPHALLPSVMVPLGGWVEADMQEVRAFATAMYTSGSWGAPSDKDCNEMAAYGILESFRVAR